MDRWRTFVVGQVPDIFEGLVEPRYCPRQRSDCESLDFIITRGHGSFICCGERDVPDDDPVPQDCYRVCFKGPGASRLWGLGACSPSLMLTDKHTIVTSSPAFKICRALFVPHM